MHLWLMVNVLDACLLLVCGADLLLVYGIALA